MYYRQFFQLLELLNETIISMNYCVPKARHVFLKTFLIFRFNDVKIYVHIIVYIKK